MEYDPYDSSGTDDDLPPAHQNRAIRGPHPTGNGRNTGPFPYPRQQNNDMEKEIHRLEREAYTSVLRAFKAQADAISWEKENLITDLRRELRLSDDEHRELLTIVNSDEVTRRIREWRQNGGAQSIMHPQSSRGAHDTEPGGPALSDSRKRHLSPVAVPVAPPNQPGLKWGPSSAGTKPKKPKTVIAAISTPAGPSNRCPVPGNRAPLAGIENPASLIGRKILTRWPEDNTFYEAIIKEYDPLKGTHALVYDIGTKSETWEWINLKEIAADDIRWEGEDLGGITERKHLHNGGARAARGRGPPGLQSRSKKEENVGPTQNGIQKKGSDNIHVPNTETIIKEVERVLSNPDIHEIEKAKKLLKEHEQSLLDAIARLAEASDCESGTSFSFI
ncbi:Protein EMSY-LIKE 3 [Carex littledalei]|uniref:Protein EMSY-LIKE 3 n=1 Tax=Carex littledalei TaxID=544730 RepID=A0A833VCL6_9POAL|nr:Protein EMSY-LIKE 3 [Carex littledalei]